MFIISKPGSEEGAKMVNLFNKTMDIPVRTYEVFGFVWLVLFGASLFVVWRAARETLSPDIGPALMVVVLWVGLGVLTDQLGALLTGAKPPG